MRSTVIAERYAAALYEVAEKEKGLDALVEEARKLLAILEKEPRLMDFLRSPQIPDAEHRRFINEAFRSVAKILRNLTFLLLDKRRIEHLPKILDLFLKEHDRRRGLLTAQFISAKPVGEEITSRLRERLERKLSQKVKLQVVQDEAVVGGFVFITETLLIDASVRRQLTELRAHLAPHL
ncbi:MAG TPA: ATP synthase F1 subunit delta [Nitrospiria bacterium]|nr:ATP synthase F1 subunit delta [Nitrospiria bacterium]